MSIPANHDPGAPNPSFETLRPFDPGPRRRNVLRPDLCDRHWSRLHEFIGRTDGRDDPQDIRTTAVWFEGLGFWPVMIPPGASTRSDRTGSASRRARARGAGLYGRASG